MTYRTDAGEAIAAEKTATSAPQWTVVIPYFNEEAYLSATLASLAVQTAGRFVLVLVDNASTDNSPAIAAAFAEKTPELDILLLREEQPGQAAALECGMRAAKTPFLAICDADTIYPPEYLARARRNLEQSNEIAAAVAFNGRGDGTVRDRMQRLKGRLVSLLMPNQCHGGGYAQAFRRDMVMSAGGYSPDLWPYCLKDHELMHRVRKKGRIAYSADHWCSPSPRRSDRSGVRWTLFERIMYHVTPYRFKDWFFYRFLRERFEARGLRDTVLRKRDWDEA